MVSVIVPIYNTEKFLRSCLDSLASQTFADFEAVLVNDGSTDSSPSIAAEYCARDSRFRLFSKANGGLSSARNHGILNARGGFFLFLDSDDELHPEALERLVKGLRENPEAQLFATRCIWTKSPSYHLAGRSRTMDGKVFLRDFLYQKDYAKCSICSFMIRREAVERAGYFKEGIFYEDLDYILPLLLNAGPILVSEDIYYFYRKNTASILGLWNIKRLDVLDVVDGIVAEVAHEEEGLRKAALSRRFSAYFNMFLLSTAHGCREGADRCWTVIKQLRARMISDPEVRLKNKLGALISYLGRRTTALFARK